MVIKATPTFTSFLLHHHHHRPTTVQNWQNIDSTLNIKHCLSTVFALCLSIAIPIPILTNILRRNILFSFLNDRIHQQINIMCQLAPYFVQVKWSVKREKKVGQVNRELFVWKMILNYIEIFCFILVPNHLLLEMLILLLLRQKFLQFELN